VFSPFLPRWARITHPIVANETRHWRRSRLRHVVRGGSWVGALLVILSASGCVTAIAATSSPTFRPADTLLVGVGTFIFSAVALSMIINWLIGLVAGIYAATLIARERETQAWPFLRITTLSSLDILGGKFAALFHLLSNTLHLIAFLRVLAIGSALVWAGLGLLASRLTLNDIWEGIESAARIMFPAYPAFLGLGLLGGLISLVAWVLEPYYATFYAGAVGLAVSAMAKTRGGAVALAFITHFGLGLAVYLPAQQFTSIIVVLLFGEQLGNSPSAVMWLGLLPFVITFLIQTAILIISLAFAYARVETLSE